jgi:hypothetical protein
MRVLPGPRQQYLKNLFAFNGNPKKTPVDWMPCAGLYSPIDYPRPLSWETQSLHTMSSVEKTLARQRVPKNCGFDPPGCGNSRG